MMMIIVVTSVVTIVAVTLIVTIIVTLFAFFPASGARPYPFDIVAAEDTEWLEWDLEAHQGVIGL